VVVDASQPLDKVITDAERAINEALVEDESHRG
jgi:hypothetical protein